MPVAGALGLALQPLLSRLETESPKSKPPVQGTPDKAAGPRELPAATDSGSGAARDASRSAPSPSGTPSFDIARIDPNGTSVFAGRGAPHSTVTVLADGAPLGSAKVDENGEWTFVTDRKVAREARLELSAGLAVAAAREADATVGTGTRPPAEAQSSARPSGAESKERPPAEAPGDAKGVASQFLRNLETMVAAAREAQDARTPQTKSDATHPEVGSVPPAGGLQPAPAGGLQPAPPAQPPQLAERVPPSVGTRGAPPAAAPAPPTPSARAVSIPIPVLFVFNEATFTPEGRRAAELLLDFLRLKKFDSVTFTGHADERGTEAYNIELSRERLEAVARFLREGGYGGKMTLIPKGKSEPFTGVDRTKFSREELYQLDRRVELHVSP